MPQFDAANPGHVLIDAANEPVIDPTKNVLDLVAAAIQRQDDLRRAEMHSISELIAARFSALEHELSVVEVHRVEQKNDNRLERDTALVAAEKLVREHMVASEKAITKSETATAEQSRQQNEIFSAALQGVSNMQADLKDRVVKIESRREGSGDLRVALMGVLAILAAIAAVVSPHIK